MVQLCVSDGSVFQTWEALTENADLLKVLFLRGTTSHGRPCGSAAICLGFLFNKNIEWRGSQAIILHKIFPTQELMLSKDVTMMMAIGLPIKHFESLFVDRLNRF